MALDRKTGKVVCCKTLGDDKAGYSYTAAPMIVKGNTITGVSAGEFRHCRQGGSPRRQDWRAGVVAPGDRRPYSARSMARKAP